MESGKKIYFASDFHLGAPDAVQSKKREEKIIGWLADIENQAEEIFLVGDIFDFWFEYKNVIPKGFVRLQGKIAEMSDKGIPIHFFTGNHDMWMFNYFKNELNVNIYTEPIVRQWNNKKFLIGHGDGLGPGDRGYKFIKRIFSSKISQWLFARLHPNFGIGMANYWSRKSRANTGNSESEFLGENQEWLIQYCNTQLEQEHYNYFIFGHRHLPIEFQLKNDAYYYNLGDWIQYDTFVEFDGTQCQIKKYRHKDEPKNYEAFGNVTEK